MALTQTSVAAGGIDKTIADAISAFQQVNVMLPLVSVKVLPIGSNVAQWSDETEIGSSSVDALTEGGDQSTVTSMTSAARSATLAEHVIRADLGDLVVRGSGVNLPVLTGAKLGNAVGRKMDSDLALLGQSFTATVAGAGTQLAISHLFGIMQALRAANAPFPYNFVGSDKTIWGAKGLQQLVIQVGNATTNTAVPHSLLGDQGRQMLNEGYVTSIGSLDIWWTNEVDDDVSSGGDAGGFGFSAGAIGCAVPEEGIMGLELERNASARATENVETGLWGEIEIKDGFGVTALHDVS